MKKRLLSLFCGLLAAVLLLPFFVVHAEETEEVPAVTEEAPFTPESVTSTAAVVYNIESETALFEKNMDSRLNPAAFTKLMTALLAFEYRAANGNVNVTVTEEMLSSAGGTSMKLKVGEEISFDALLSGLVVQNANDAALVLASVVGGNIAAFVEDMNERAKEMGMEQTYYANPTGVDSAVMYTTMKDTLTLCKALYRVNDFMLLSENPKVTIPATNLTEERVYTNKNALVPYSYVTDYYIKGVRGMVAGFTSGAGYCVATTRQKENATFIVIVSGGVDRSEAQNGTDISSYREAKGLLEWAEESYSFRKLLPKGKIISEKKVRLGAGVDHMILVTGNEFTYLLPTNEIPEQAISYKLRIEHETFTAPIIEGETYGELDLVYNDEVIGTVPLVAQANIGLSRWLVMWDAVVGFFSQGPAKAVLILAAISAVLYVAVLIGTVWLQYARKTRDKRQAMNELMAQEDRRLRKVRLEERKANLARMHRVRGALREGFRVLSGEAEVLEPNRKSKAQPQRKAVAKLPEKYRTQQNRPVGTRPAANGQSIPRRPVQNGQAPRNAHQRTQNAQARNSAPQARRPEQYRVSRPSQNDNRRTGGNPKLK